jgi:hypothetical protein
VPVCLAAYDYNNYGYELGHRRPIMTAGSLLSDCAMTVIGPLLAITERSLMTLSLTRLLP